MTKNLSTFLTKKAENCGVQNKSQDNWISLKQAIETVEVQAWVFGRGAKPSTRAWARFSSESSVSQRKDDEDEAQQN